MGGNTVTHHHVYVACGDVSAIDDGVDYLTEISLSRFQMIGSNSPTMSVAIYMDLS